MKVAIFGASGIIGQHMRLCVPLSINPIWLRNQADRRHVGLDLTNSQALSEFLESEEPEVVLNLAGESRPDVVEGCPGEFYRINVAVPQILGRWCLAHGRHYIHVSTQGVFSGEEPPYFPGSFRHPINAYGRQKVEAENQIERMPCAWTILRPTFILGVRPLPHVGRSNPIEQMLEGQVGQVDNRWFSVLFARTAAAQIWKIILRRPHGIIHLGIPGSASRHEIASLLGCKSDPLRHEHFAGIATRPINTSYESVKPYSTELDEGLKKCREDWEGKRTMDVPERAREIALFLGLNESEAFYRLCRGFGSAHADVADDFRAANPGDSGQLLSWYLQTESYIWELSAYHADQGFNYSGMCRGIQDRLLALPARRVLCLGDGIGDMTLTLRRAGIEAFYNDLSGSRTAGFARFRYWMREGRELPEVMNRDWAPEFNGGGYDAVVACDILEHVPDVPGWVAAIKSALVPGGRLMAQNAFGAGSGPDGSIPMHLSCNDRFEKDWDPLLTSMGFRQESSNWYQKL
jgi:dTDP-4-dehydrorhamnose reductase